MKLKKSGKTILITCVEVIVIFVLVIGLLWLFSWI